MRVISGTARGLKLISLDGDNTRPTLDNVKEAVFSMLYTAVNGVKILDLFAGSGQLGIEALSRGADYCVFADKSRRAISVAKSNAEKARVLEKSKFYTSDFKSCLSTLSAEKEIFDIIFLDPPYALGYLSDALEIIKTNKLLVPGGLIVIEFDNGTEFNIHGYTIIKDRKYGRVCINILEES